MLNSGALSSLDTELFQTAMVKVVFKHMFKLISCKSIVSIAKKYPHPVVSRYVLLNKLLQLQRQFKMGMCKGTHTVHNSTTVVVMGLALGPLVQVVWDWIKW